MKRPEWEENSRNTFSQFCTCIESIMIIDWQIYYYVSLQPVRPSWWLSIKWYARAWEGIWNLRIIALHCYSKSNVFMLNVFMLNTWFLFKWKIERFQFQHLIFIRFLGFTACGMPLCTKHNNFVWPLFLAILDFSNGACSEFRVTYIVACSRMRGNTVDKGYIFTILDVRNG